MIVIYASDATHPDALVDAVLATEHALRAKCRAGIDRLSADNIFLLRNARRASVTSEEGQTKGVACSFFEACALAPLVSQGLHLHITNRAALYHMLTDLGVTTIEVK